jgi:hypothetical protein
MTVEYLLKKLAQKNQKAKFMHKTRYGRSMPQRFSYDQQSHEEEHMRTKDLPFDPLIHWK